MGWTVGTLLERGEVELRDLFRPEVVIIGFVSDDADADGGIGRDELPEEAVRDQDAAAGLAVLEGADEIRA